MTPEQKEKLKKVYALVNQGATEGERAAAKKALDKLLEKYNLTGVDLDALDKDWYDFKYTTDMEFQLIFRLCRTLINHMPYAEAYGRGLKRMRLSMTYLDYIMLSSAYEYFRRHMKLQWKKFAAPQVARCRSVKTKNVRRKELQGVFFSKYVIASNLYKPDELTTVDTSKLSKKEQQGRAKMQSVEGGKYNTQVTNGLYLESLKLN